MGRKRVGQGWDLPLLVRRGRRRPKAPRVTFPLVNPRLPTHTLSLKRKRVSVLRSMMRYPKNKTKQKSVNASACTSQGL